MVYNVANLTRSSTRELELVNLIKNVTPDIAIITECELDPADTLSVPGYAAFPAKVSPIGTIRLIVLVALHIANTTSIIETTYMDIWLSVSGLLVSGVYRQWAVDDEGAELEAFHTRCAKNVTKSGKVFIGGDFNLDASRLEDTSYCRHSLLRKHFTVMESLGLLFAGPNNPTYYSYGKYNGSTRTSVLDYGFVAGLTTQSVSVLNCAATDHRPVVFSLPIGGGSRTRSKLTLARNLRKVDTVTLCSAIDKHIPTDLYELTEVDFVHDIIVRAITLALDEVAPLRQVRTRDGNTLYLAEDTKAAMRARDVAATSNTSHYRSLRNLVVKLVRRDRLFSIRRTIAQSRGNVKQVWRLAKEAVGLTTPSSLPSSLTATALNTYYVDKVEKLRASIKPGSIPTACLTPDPTSNFSFKYPSAGVVASVIKGLKNTGAIGADGISVEVLKKAVDTLASPIAHLVRLSFATSRVPTGFKLATITPIFKAKGKDPLEEASYRPVAILSALSKVLERIVAMNLNTHLTHLLPNGQFGFRPNRNSTAAIATVHGSMSDFRSMGNVTATAAYDFSSAFDTVDNSILLTKLDRLGVRGKELKWFADYLNSRYQRVSANGNLSPYLHVKYGVPQGSILGPVLFLCMVAELPASLPVGLGGSVGYADDVVAYAVGKTTNEVKTTLENVSTAIINYAGAHFLAINPSKTQIMWAGHKDVPSVLVGNSIVPEATSVDLLGVGFNKSLRPTPYFAQQMAAARRILGLTRRLMCHLPPNLVAMVSRSLFNGKLGYGLAAAATPRLCEADPIQSAVQELQVIVNSAARTIMRRKRADHIPIYRLLADTGLPSLNRLLIRAVALEAWRAVCVRDGPGGTKNPLGILLGDPGSGTRITRSTTAGLLPSPHSGKDTLVWSAVRIWNSCADLRTASTLSAAKTAAFKMARLAPL